jgi:ankyrin repeat protein
MEYPLIDACEQNDLGGIRELLDHGTDPNSRDSGGWTALMIASHRGHIDVVRLLLDHGADPNLQDGYGWSASIWASCEGNIGVVKLLEAFSGWNRNVAQPLMDLGIFPEGLIREHLMISV